MASPSPWTWPWKTLGDSSIKLSYCPSFNSSAIFTFRRIHKKRTRLTTFSLDSSSSSSSSSSASSSSSTSVCSAVQEVRKEVRKSVKPLTFRDNWKNEVSVKSVGSAVQEVRKDVRKSEQPFTFGDNSKNGVSVNRTESQKRPTFSFKSLFPSKKVSSIILLNVIAVVYASNIPVIKEVEAIVDPAAFTVVRFAIAAIPFIPFVWRARGDAQTRNAGIELGFWVSLGYLMQALGLLSSDAGRASFIFMLTVIVVPFLDGMLGAVVPARTWFGALMSVLGIAMLESSGSPPSVGDLLNFLGAVFWGIHMLRTEHISRSTDNENLLPLLGYEVGVVALFSALWYFLGGWFGGIQESNPSPWTLTMFWDQMAAFPWVPALYTGIFSTGLCLWAEIVAMRDVSATDTAIIYSLQPVWGAGFAWFLLGERWGITGWIGAALVLGGSLTVQILGSSSSSLPREGEDSMQGDRLLVSDEQSGFSTSPIVVSSRKISGERSGFSTSPIIVRSRKDVADVLKK